jgi:hypothetical protein
MRRIAPVRAAVAGKVEVDDLRDVRQPVEVRLEVGVVEAPRPAVQQDDGRSLAELRPVGHQCRPFDVEPQPHSVDLDVHPASFAPVRGGRVRLLA